MKIIDSIAKLIPENVAHRIVRKDTEGWDKPPLRDVDYENAIDENIVQGSNALIGAIPYVGAAMPTINLLGNGGKNIVVGSHSTAQTVQRVLVLGVLPYTTLTGNPIAWVVNAVANVSSALVDFAQAAAWTKLYDLHSAHK